jgi:putative nucleotidyltransferase with HDIG domain
MSIQTTLQPDCSPPFLQVYSVPVAETTSTKKLGLQIIRRLTAQGFEAYFAGGCVRDMLLKRRPKDYDVATSAHPEQVEALFPHTVAVGKSFGVIRVREGSTEIEVATFRSEGKYLDGRRPSSVSFTSSEEDAQRRDFTVNGLFHDPLKRKVVDYVGGRADLRKRIIRCIGNPDERFEEDRLRILRAIRLATQLRFKIHPRTWKAILARAESIRSVSAERIRDELTKLLLAPERSHGLRLLQKSGLLKILLPEIEAMRGVGQPRRFHPEGDVFVHTLLVLDMLNKNPSAQLAWAALLHDVGKPPTFEISTWKGIRRIRFPEHARVGAEMAQKILSRLRFSNSDREAIVAMVANHMTFKDVQQMKTSTLKRLLARPTIEDEIELHIADCKGSHHDIGNAHFVRRKRREFSEEELQPKPLITGRDLIKLGLKPGPEFGKILKELYEAQLEGRVRTYEAAMAHIRQLSLPGKAGKSKHH